VLGRKFSAKMLEFTTTDPEEKRGTSRTALLSSIQAVVNFINILRQYSCDKKFKDK